MQVLTATNEQYEQLNGYRNGNNVLKFGKNANGKWIVGLEVLECHAFAEIRSDLQLLECIEYNPPELRITDVE